MTRRRVDRVSLANHFCARRHKEMSLTTDESLHVESCWTGLTVRLFGGCRPPGGRQTSLTLLRHEVLHQLGGCLPQSIIYFGRRQSGYERRHAGVELGSRPICIAVEIRQRGKQSPLPLAIVCSPPEFRAGRACICNRVGPLQPPAGQI
jgi:hypothetical protein